jgi:chromosome segregation ATPase
MKTTSLLGTLAMLWLALAGHTAFAATPRDGGDQADRRTQFMLRQLTAEKTALQQENADLHAQVQAQAARIAELEKDTERQMAALDKADERIESMTRRIREDLERYKTLSERYTDTSGTLRDARTDIELLINAVGERDAWIDDCRAKNQDMFDANQALLNAYRDKGALAALMQNEPATGLGLVRVENAVQEYRYRLEDLRTAPFAGEAAPETKLKTGETPDTAAVTGSDERHRGM